MSNYRFWLFPNSAIVHYSSIEFDRIFWNILPKGLYLQSLTLHKFFITIDSAVKKFSYSVKLYRTENQRLCCIILGNRTVSNSTELKSLIGFKPFAFLFVIFEPEVDNQYIIYRTMLPGGALKTPLQVSVEGFVYTNG